MAVQYNQNLIFCGLGTVSVTVPNAAVYFVDVKTSLPTLVGGAGASALVIVINKNGVAQYTGIAGASGAEAYVNCAVGDVIAVVFSSAAAPDQGLNVIKSVIAISQGDAA